VRPSPFTRRVAAAITVLLAGSGLLVVATPGPASADQTTCETGTLPRQRTEVNTDVAVPQFNPSLGTLVSVSVPTQTVHLDTDAEFQNTAQSSVVFSEDMQYQFTLTSPGGLASPAPLTGMIQRIPTTTLAPFSGTLNYMGPSAVVEPSTSRDAAAAAVSSSDPAVLTAFTGTGSVPFHVQSMISEVFNGGGGNVQAIIDTFVGATLQVCYTYAAPQVSAAPPVTAPPPAPPTLAPQFTG
jgi:hypothetical protein